MEKYVICMDASGDIAKDVVRENEIEFVPMEYTVQDEVFIADGTEDDSVMKQFYARQREGAETRTSQITPYAYEEAFRKYLEQGYSVLYFCLSSGLSSTYESSLLAVENLKEEYPGLEVCSVDTLAATGGIGVLVEKAIENRRNGVSVKANYDDICACVSHIHHFFMVEDLMYLLRGGRVSAASAYMGSMLNIKPILKIDEKGELVTIAKKRGHKAAVQCLAELFEEYYDPSMGNTVYLCTGDSMELQKELQEKIKEKHPELVCRITYLCPVIGAHTGPGMISVIFLGK